MAVVVALPLFGPPDRELEERAAVTGAQLRKLATELADRLNRVAGILDQLKGAGWSAQVGHVDLMLAHPHVQTPDDATKRLRELNIDPEQFLIVEDVEEDE